MMQVTDTCNNNDDDDNKNNNINNNNNKSQNFIGFISAEDGY